MKEVILNVKENKRLNADTYQLTLSGDCTGNLSGQFVEVLLNGFTLRRPFGVCDCDDNNLTILYKVVGAGTKSMTSLNINDKLNVLTSLGNGFNLGRSQKPLLIGGGIGAAPLYFLAKEFYKRGITPKVLLGFKDKEEIFFVDEFSKISDLTICTDNGSYGYKHVSYGYKQGVCSQGNKINAVSAYKEFEFDNDFYYACGPLPMLKALKDYDKNGELSLEARMGCGFGACMGCTIKTTNGFKRVCKEGPVFYAEEVIFD